MSSVSQQWIHDARASIKNGPEDFFKVEPAKYWWDLVLCAFCAYAAATVYLLLPLTSFLKYLSFPFAVFWLYRASSMVHEVAHLNRSQLKSFKIGWNLVLGVPTLFPSTFFSSHHRDHHSGRYYGTPQDPEYIVNVFKPGSLAGTLFFCAYLSVYPIFVVLRFMLAPISFLNKNWREFTLRRLSSFTLNWKYERSVSRIDRTSFAFIELLCCVRAWMIPIAILSGVTHWPRLPQLYLLAMAVLFCNQMRFLADHHFESEGEPMSMADHVSDSCNYSKNSFLTWIFFPFTIRFHALHHLFPTIPYHNLEAAHAHLTDSLPADSKYHALDRPGWWYTVSENMKFKRKQNPHRTSQQQPASEAQNSSEVLHSGHGNKVQAKPHFTGANSASSGTNEKEANSVGG